MIWTMSYQIFNKMTNKERILFVTVFRLNRMHLESFGKTDIVFVYIVHVKHDK